MTKENLKVLRDFYGLSQRQMSEVFGFGINQWRLYEGGEEPNRSNATLIRLSVNPKSFGVLLDKLPAETKKEKRIARAIVRCHNACSDIKRFAFSVEQQVGDAWVVGGDRHADRIYIDLTLRL